MLSKNETKYIQSLAHKKVRHEEAVFLVEGPKMVDELITSKFVIKKLYALESWASQYHGNLPIQLIESTELSKISLLQNPNQVLAIVEKAPVAILPDHFSGLVLVLDGIQDPGNLGTIIRIADWFGVSQIIASEDTVDVYNPKVIQSSMGSYLRIQPHYLCLTTFLQKIDLPIYGALLNGKSIYEMPLIKDGVLVIGNESKGIRSNLLPLIEQAITIPSVGKADSLNAAIATGILVSHLLKPI